MLKRPETLTAPPVLVSSMPVAGFWYLNWRTMPATVKWPQSPFFCQRAVRSGMTLSSLLMRAPTPRYGVTVVSGFSTDTDHGPLV